MTYEVNVKFTFDCECEYSDEEIREMVEEHFDSTGGSIELIESNKIS